jgi:hypothetical protein
VALLPRGDGSRLSAEELNELVTQLNGIVEILEHADPEERRALYRERSLAAVSRDDARTQVTAGPGARTDECVGGASGTLSTRSLWTAELVAA